jgi:hypothetical protein
MSADVQELYARGYARSIPGLWLRPDGHGLVTEQQALQEIRELAADDEEDR